ncbi:hypothetical protein ACFE04_027158 [Oxalis oulophora]
MLNLKYTVPLITKGFDSIKFSNPKKTNFNFVVCGLRGPRPRYPRVWKTKTRIGTFSKSQKLVECIQGLSNVKEEVYGALDSFIAWELEFPLIAVKKALKMLEAQQDWKRIIQMIKWMLSKGQGKTMGSYFTLLNALAEDERLEEAEELWTKIFMRNLEHTPRIFFDKMVSIYYKREMHDKMFELFADMEELEVKPSISVVAMVGKVFQKLGMLDKYEKLHKKYPPPRWEYRYIRGKRVKVRANLNVDVDLLNQHSESDNSKYINGSDDFDRSDESNDTPESMPEDEETGENSDEFLEDSTASSLNNMWDNGNESSSSEISVSTETGSAEHALEANKSF